VDAAIAVLFCEGVSCIQSMGLGGGFFMTVYDKESGKVTTLNARETAPAAAYEDMYHGDAELAYSGNILSIVCEEKFQRFY
jgi:gamma-glutamyltranspeptidase/glutathione hydrolase/leukotriene-C4 hydrolase